MAHADGGEPLPWPTYRILGVTARLEELKINRRLAHLHLTQGSLEALESVADLEPATISDLAVLMSVSKQSLGKVLCRLESLVLVSKERGSDARSTIITLTARGRTVLATAEKLLDAMAEPGTGDDAALRRSLQQHLNDLRKN
ncbi:MarR family winged helix-turn-helix transcriptional regulator [Arthrobacter sp. RHLT1-20]